MAQKTVSTDEASLTITLSRQEADYLQRWAKDQGYDAAPALVRSWLEKLILLRVETMQGQLPEPLFVEDWPLEMMAAPAQDLKANAKKRRSSKKSINFSMIQDQGQNAKKGSGSYLTQLTEPEAGTN